MLPLTPYEARQVHLIAGWKAEHPSYIAGAIEKLTLPMVRLVEKILPQNAVQEAIDDAYNSSAVTAHHEKVLERAGVNELLDLRRCELSHCDELAAQFAIQAETASMFWGAGAGGGTPLSALISVRALMGYFLNTIHTIGACYGFGTAEPHEREYVLGILLISSASTLREKQNAIVNMGKVEDMIFEEAFEELLQDAIAEQMLSSGGVSSIPAIGILAGAVESARLTQQVAQIAKFIFQERWLRANNKIVRIQPDLHYARSLPVRFASQVGTAIYWAGFGVTFLISVPTVLMFGWVPRNHALGYGMADASQAANRDLRQLLSKFKAPAEEPADVLVAATEPEPAVA